MENTFRLVRYGFVAWVVPAAAILMFYALKSAGMIGENAFIACMIISSATVGIALMHRYFSKVCKRNFVVEGIRLGYWWSAINVVLDLAVLAPLMNVHLSGYVFALGIRHVFIPIVSLKIGGLLSAAEGMMGKAPSIAPVPVPVVRKLAKPSQSLRESALRLRGSLRSS
jgi:hypothetical protein